MSQTTELLLKIRQQGGEQLTKLQGSLKNLGQQSTATNVNFKQLSSELKKIQATSTNSINNLKGYSNAWREIANSVKIGSKEFKQATAEAAKLEKQLRRTQGGGGRLRGVAQTVGTVAGAAVFGGIEGAAGAGIGAVLGGVPGAIAGGAIGAQLGGFRQQAGVVGELVAELNRYRIALAGVSKDQQDYERSVVSITEFSRQFLLPLTDTTQQYTKLQASIAGAGYTATETQKVFKGIAAAITATGGTAEDLNSALRATSQVFSKGKVSAEELRQQIGERLPGAFTIFAQSINKTPQQLDAALEKGEVSLEDFLTFSEELFKRYGKTAEILGDAPENAGRRLKVALDEAAVNYGGFFQIIGAGFQNSLTQAVTWANDNGRIIKQYVTNWVNAAYAIGQALGRIIKALGGFTQRVYQFMQANPGVALANALGGFMRQRLGLQGGKGRFTVEDLFPEFKPTSFGTGLGTGAPITDLGGGDTAKADKEAERAARLQQRLLERRNELTRQAGILQRDLNEKIIETSENINALGANALQVFERQYIDKVSDAQKVTGDLLLKVFKLAKEFQDAGGKLDTTDLVKGIMDLEEAATSLAQGEYAQGLNKFLTGLDEKFASITERVYANAKAMQYNADVMGGLRDGFRTYTESLGTTREAFASLAENGMKTVEQAITDLATTGTTNYAEFAAAILRQTAQMIIQQLVLKSIMTALGFVGGGKSAAIQPLQNVAQYNASGVSFDPSAYTGNYSFAMGGIMTPKGPLDLKRYAAGGIARGPQMALYGEGSRPEAYVPLPDGRTIPVTMNGGGETVINVSVDAKGTNVQGNEGQTRQLGVAISAAVQQELIKQRRPGGLLAS